MERVRRSVRFIVNRIRYRPYFLKDGPEHIGFYRSKRSNPLVHHYDQHLRCAYEAIASYRNRRIFDITRTEQQPANTANYSDREWFAEVIEAFPSLVMRVQAERSQENADDWANANSEYNRPKVWLALLECACSLIIFNQDPRYRELSNADIESLQFPLSSWSRTVISGLNINGHNVTARARLRTTL